MAGGGLIWLGWVNMAEGWVNMAGGGLIWLEVG